MSIRLFRGAMTLLLLAGLSSMPALAQTDSGQNSFASKFATMRPKFVNAWQHDDCAQGESVSEYVDHWIYEYYFDGGGWFAQSTYLLSKLPAGAEKHAISARLDRLGAKIATEWAKPNDCRKIATSGGGNTLSAYKSLFVPFFQAGAIDPAQLETTLKILEDSVNEALQ